MLSKLIDKKDNAELVQDKILEILVLNRDRQMELAEAANRDPEGWNFRVYKEKSNPDEFFHENGPQTPGVNVWFESSDFPMSAGSVVDMTRTTTIYNIDCYAAAAAKETLEGQVPADEMAADSLRRVVTLIRNILMAGDDLMPYLGLRGLVSRRWIERITAFQPDPQQNTILNIIGARIVFSVQFNEYSPQYEGQPLEIIGVTIKRAEDGQIIAKTELN